MEKNKKILFVALSAIGTGLLLKKIFMDQSIYASKNFKFSEFDSRDGAPMPDNIKKNIKKLAQALEIVRAEIGVPIKITSGYRSPQHNASIKGAAKNSYHIKGMAADLQTRLTPIELARVIERLILEGKIPQGGLGVYNNWVHYDIRGKKTRWGR